MTDKNGKRDGLHVSGEIESGNQGGNSAHAHSAARASIASEGKEDDVSLRARSSSASSSSSAAVRAFAGSEGKLRKRITLKRQHPRGG